MRVLVAGASGFIGRRLVPALAGAGNEVAALVRDQETPRAAQLARAGAELRRGDLTDAGGVDAALEGAAVAYYLAHLMGDPADGDLAAAEGRAAQAFARAATRAGVGRVIYLGGLGDPEASEHLRARHRTALLLRSEGPPLTYFRAAMVVGAGSESYVLLKSLVERVPAMVYPEWLENLTQPIGVRDVVDYLAAAPSVEAARGREVQIGGPDVMTYSQMLAGMAAALGRDVPRRLPTPRGIESKAVGTAVGSITRGDRRVAEHITAGLATDTVVTDPSGAALFEIEPEPYRLTLARAVEEEARAMEREAAP